MKRVGEARAEEPTRTEGADRAEEPIRVAVEEVSVLAEPEGAFLQPIREAIEAVERRYRPLRVAMRGVGSALKSTAVGEYPDLVQKLKKEAVPNRKELDKMPDGDQQAGHFGAGSEGGNSALEGDNPGFGAARPDYSQGAGEAVPTGWEFYPE